MIALDTNICIAFLKGEPAVRDAILAHEPSDVVLPTVVIGELMFGAYNSRHINENVRRVRAFASGLRAIAFDSAAADHYGRIRTLLQRSGSMIGGNDMLIAATSMAHGATLVTRNVAEFERVVGLDVVSW